MLHIFAGSASQALSQAVATQLRQPLGQLQVHHFADGEMRPQLLDQVRGSHVCLIQSTHPPASHLLELLLTADAARHAGAHTITLVVPYLGYMRQDRLHPPGPSLGAQLQARLMATAGVDRLVTGELHAPHLMDYFSFPVHELSSRPLFLPYLQQLPRLTVVGPDAGSAARAMAYAQALGVPCVLGKKHKSPEHQATGITLVGSVAGADVLLVDDLVDTGRTLSLAVQQILRAGARSVRAVCSHAILSKGAWQRLATAGLHELLVTDSIPLEAHPPNIRVHSMAPLIAQALKDLS